MHNGNWNFRCRKKHNWNYFLYIVAYTSDGNRIYHQEKNEGKWFSLTSFPHLKAESLSLLAQTKIKNMFSPVSIIQIFFHDGFMETGF
jgi:hypothetical protein